MKKKTLVLIGIAVCAILLTAPVLASAGYSKIYGNANEDDVLDMRDVTYIKLVIFGKKPATTFADANYDGKISMLDVGQTKLIILGKEKELTLVDMADRTVTVPRPIERVIDLDIEHSRIMVALGAADKIVGIESRSLRRTSSYSCGWGILKFAEAYPEKAKFVEIDGTNIEQIVSLKPDVIFSYPETGDPDTTQEKTGIPVVCARSYYNWEDTNKEIKLMAKVLEAEKEADELISWINEKNAEVTDVTSEIHESDKPKVYLLFWGRWNGESKTPPRYDPVDLAGGINVARDILIPSGTSVCVSIEQIIEWNPDIILIHHHSKTSYPEVAVDVILSDPRLQTVNAVKNHKVYYTLGLCRGWDYPRVLTETVYMAKLFHPEEFEDLDLEVEGNEIFERFYHVDGLWTELGTELGFIE